MLVTLDVVRTHRRFQASTLLHEARTPALGRMPVGAQLAMRGADTHAPWSRARTRVRARWLWRRDGWGLPTDLKRVVLIHGWSDEAAIEPYRASLADAAAEHWSVDLQPLRATSIQGGVTAVESPGPAARAVAEAPGIVITWADVPMLLVPEWLHHLSASVEQQHASPGALASLGTLKIAPARAHGFTISCWRRLGDALDYAYRDADHRATMTWYRELVEDGSRAATWFGRFLLERSRGTLDGRDPFGGIAPMEVTADDLQATGAAPAF